MYWRKDFAQIRKIVDGAIAKGGGAEPFYMMEAHFGWVEFANVVFPDLQRLDQHLKRRGLDCPLVTMTRVREPLEFYLSFYRWAVAFRQRADPHSFGKDFIDWARRVPDLQSTTMMQSMAAMAAEYHINQWSHYRSSWMVGKTEEERWTKLQAVLDQFAIVATMKRFDESVLLASDLSGLPLLQYKRNKPNQKGGFRGTSQTVCPDMDKCREVIKQVAPRDHKMYDKYSTAFEARIAALGDGFARRVQLFKQSVNDIQPTWKQVPRKQFICRYHRRPPPGRRRSRSLLRCPVPGGGPLPNTYAHRLFGPVVPPQLHPRRPARLLAAESGFNRSQAGRSRGRPGRVDGWPQAAAFTSGDTVRRSRSPPTAKRHRRALVPPRDPAARRVSGDPSVDLGAGLAQSETPRDKKW